MYCPKCGKENSDDARFCNSCGCQLTQHPATTGCVNVRISKAAIVSLLCALCGLACFMPAVVAVLDPRLLSPKSDVVHLSSNVSLLAAGVAVILGVTALGLIGSSGGRLTGYGFAAIGTTIPLLQILVLFYLPTFPGRRTLSTRAVCGTNLSWIGKAMLVYSQDYDDALPRAGGPNGRWVARLPWWAADNLKDAYGLSDPNPTEGRASISASLYLLVKYAELQPKSFVCKEDFGTTEFKPAKYGLGDKKLIDFWDFGPNPPRHCSYAYHMPYGPYHLTTSSPPGLAVAADRNPWIDSPFAKSKDFILFKPDIAPFNGTEDDARQGNTIAHEGDGQNVLFMDSHVEFIKRSYRRSSYSAEDHRFKLIKDGDNIYTYWDGEDKVRGTPPVLGSQPTNRLDSLLVNDPAISRWKVALKAGKEK